MNPHTWSERGALTLPMTLMLSVVMVASVGLLSLMFRWRSLAAHQLRLDRCVGSVAIDLRDSLLTIQRINREITGLRASLAVATIAPPVRATLQATLEAEVVRQELERGRWGARRIKWLARRGCDGEGDIPFLLPEQPWTRDPPDFLGPRPLRWTGDLQAVFRIELHHSPRHSAAEVSAAGTDSAAGSVGGIVGGSFDTRNWKASWAVVGTGFL